MEACMKHASKRGRKVLPIADWPEDRPCHDGSMSLFNDGTAVAVRSQWGTGSEYTGSWGEPPDFFIYS
jgi:hypothetical protein